MEPDLCLFVEIDFRGVIRVDLGLGFWQTKKKTRVGERGRETKNSCRGKMKSRWGCKKKSKILFACSDIGVHTTAKHDYAAA